MVVGGPNAQSGVDIGSLIKHGTFVGFGVTVGVFQDEDAVAFFSGRIFRIVGVAVVQGLTNPNPAPFIYMQIGGIDEHRFGSKQLHITTFGHFHAIDGIFGQAFGRFVQFVEIDGRFFGRTGHK